MLVIKSVFLFFILIIILFTFPVNLHAQYGDAGDGGYSSGDGGYGDGGYDGGYGDGGYGDGGYGDSGYGDAGYGDGGYGDSGYGDGGYSPPPTCPTTSDPRSLSPSGNVDYGPRTMTWNADWATEYYLRIDDKTTGGWNPVCDGQVKSDGDLCYDRLTSRSYTYDFKPGHSYTWWVHAANQCTFTAGVAADVFAVPPPATGNISANPNPCLTYSSTNCSSTISWSTTNAGSVDVRRNGGTWQTAASGNVGDTQDVNTITYELYATDLGLTTYNKLGEVKVSAVVLMAPSINTNTCAGTGISVNLSWNRNPLYSYSVLRTDGATESRIATNVGSASFTDTSGQSNSAYSYRLEVSGPGGFYTTNSTPYITTKNCAPPVISSITVACTNNSAISSSSTNITQTNAKLLRARSFNGSSTYLLNSRGVDLANKSFSVSAWIKRNVNNTFHWALTQGINTQNLGLHLGFRDTNVFTCAFYGNDLNTTAAYTDSNYHLWTCTYDASTNARKLYRDNSLVASDTATADYQGVGGIDIGRRGVNNSGYFNGVIDELGIWGKVLSSSDVTSLYNSGTGRTYDSANSLYSPTSNIMLYYNFDELSGTGAQTAVNANSIPTANVRYSTVAPNVYSYSLLRAADSSSGAGSGFANDANGFLDEGLVSYWKMDETSGYNVLDSSLTSANNGGSAGANSTVTVDAKNSNMGGNVTTVHASDNLWYRDTTNNYMLTWGNEAAGTVWTTFTNIVRGGTYAATMFAWSSNGSIIYQNPSGSSDVTLSLPTSGTNLSLGYFYHSGANPWTQVSFRNGGGGPGDRAVRSISLTGPNPLSSNITAGKLGNARIFSGTSQYVAVPPASTLDLKTGITLSSWVKPSVLPTSGNYGYIAGKGNTGSNEPYFLRFFNSGGTQQLQFGMFNGSNHMASWNHNLTANNWYHILGTFDGATWRLYVNGELKASASDSTTPQTNTKPFLIGANDANGTISRFFNGTIDEVGLWNRALTGPASGQNCTTTPGNEVCILYNTGVGNSYTPVEEPGLIQDIWGGQTGTTINQSLLTASPDKTTVLTSNLEIPQSSPDQNDYQRRLAGLITAPQTGNYTFWLSGDDDSELYLSTTSYAANKSRIAYFTGWTNEKEWTKFSTQKSSQIALTQGEKYYIEVLQKEGTGGDNLAVGWSKPGQSTTSPSEVIPASALSHSAGGSTSSIPVSLGSTTLTSYLDQTIKKNNYYAYQVSDYGAGGTSPNSAWEWADEAAPVCESDPPTAYFIGEEKKCFTPATFTSEVFLSEAYDTGPLGSTTQQSGVEQVIYRLQNTKDVNRFIDVTATNDPLTSPSYKYQYSLAELTQAGGVNQNYRMSIRAIDYAGNSSSFASAVPKDFSVADSCLSPWIQTTTGDVHTNTKIDAPGGPE